MKNLVVVGQQEITSFQRSLAPMKLEISSAGFPETAPSSVWERFFQEVAGTYEVGFSDIPEFWLNARPNGPGDSSPGPSPKADALGKRAPHPGGLKGRENLYALTPLARSEAQSIVVGHLKKSRGLPSNKGSGSAATPRFCYCQPKPRPRVPCFQAAPCCQSLHPGHRPAALGSAPE